MASARCVSFSRDSRARNDCYFWDTALVLYLGSRNRPAPSGCCMLRPTMARTHRATARAALLGLLLTPIAALAWNNGADFETSIHGHDFSRVTFESDRCQVKVRLLF